METFNINIPSTSGINSVQCSEAEKVMISNDNNSDLTLFTQPSLNNTTV